MLHICLPHRIPLYEHKGGAKPPFVTYTPTVDGLCIITPSR